METTNEWRTVVVGALALLAVGGCADFAGEGCSHDAECKLGRICSAGLCVDSALDVPAPGAVSSHLAGVAGAGGGPADASPPTDDGSLTTAVPPTAAPAPAAEEEPAPATTEPAPTRDVSGIEFLCTPGGAGACQNETDCPVIEDGSGKEVAKQCGIECATSLVPGCAEQCILDRTPLTGPCAGCLGAFFDCILSTCLAPCISGTEQDCTECSRTKPVGGSCSDQWYECSGTELNSEYVGG